MHVMRAVAVLDQEPENESHKNPGSGVPKRSFPTGIAGAGSSGLSVGAAVIVGVTVIKGDCG